jgi:hypothetical protein
MKILWTFWEINLFKIGLLNPYWLERLCKTMKISSNIFNFRVEVQTRILLNVNDSVLAFISVPKKSLGGHRTTRNTILRELLLSALRSQRCQVRMRWIGSRCPTESSESQPTLTFGRVRLSDRLCGLVVRVPGYTTEMYCASCVVRTEFVYIT